MKYCCDYFPKVALSVKWFTWTNKKNETFYLMPCIGPTDERVRLNYCPVCGAKIRDIIIPEEEFNLLKD